MRHRPSHPRPKTRTIVGAVWTFLSALAIGAVKDLRYQFMLVSFLFSQASEGYREYRSARNLSTASSSKSMTGTASTTTSSTMIEATSKPLGHKAQKRHANDNNNNNNNTPMGCLSATPKNRQAEEKRLARRETRTVHALRAAVALLLIASATLVCTAVYLFTRNGETKQYEREYEDNAEHIIESFHDAVERKFGAIHTMATQITSYATTHKIEFPYVTLPDFAMRGADLRVQADAVIVHWLPLVTDDDRGEWERFALRERAHIDQAFFQDKAMREAQDELFGLSEKTENGPSRNLAVDREDESLLAVDEESPLAGTLTTSRTLAAESASSTSPVVTEETMLEDGTGYHSRIWSIGSVDPRGDYVNGTGPYLVAWQRSPINGARQRLLNLNFGRSFALQGVLDILLESPQAIMNKASFPIAAGLEQFKANLLISQYRHNVESYIDDPLTFLVYPVFDSFGPDRKIAGVLATNIFWKLFFANILPPSASGIVCVIENSFNQSFSYLVEGPDVTYLGQGDAHNPDFDHLAFSTDVNSYLQSTASPETVSFGTVPLHTEYGVYKLHVYPAEGADYSNDSWIYTLLVAAAFCFTSLVFVLFSIAVERRQRVVMRTAIANAEKAASAATELNEFLSHEVRNPLSAAISASTFVDTALAETKCITDVKFQESMQEDVKIVRASLTFVNDFLRSMIDYSRAQGNRLELRLTPTDILTDVLEPVRGMLYNRDTNVKISVDCPEGLVVMTDSLRLKQVVMNLGRNSVKFVQGGFIRFRGRMVDDAVEISVEDSGPGIPVDKQVDLFDKFQTSLDELGQGTGLGLSLCKTLVDLLGGKLWLDNDFNSGVEGYPGARFVIRLDSSTIPDAVIDEDESDSLPKSPASPLHTTKDIAIDNNQDHSSSSEEHESSPTLPENLTVLFVDDDLVLRKLFARAVRKVAPSWAIFEAANGETALRMVDDRDFDIIFVDQYMASTEKILLGTETVRALRSKGVTRSLLCGLSANDLDQAFAAAGANAFIMKPMPCAKEELTRELVRVLATAPNVKNNKGELLDEETLASTVETTT